MACSVACSSHAPAAPGATVPTQIVSVEGLVTDVLDQPLGRATVTVEGDPNANAVTVTDDQGKFAASLTLTADASITVRVNAEGFAPAVQEFEIGPHPTAVVRTWVGLSALSPLNLSGTYRVALRADGSCSSQTLWAEPCFGGEGGSRIA
jgi:Carboxypeptidase regulatory-like domain